MNRFERALSAGCFGVTVACGASAWAQTTERVSVSSAEIQGNGSSVLRSSVSADGRYVAFRSLASNLVSGDTNATWDVFRRDLQDGTTVRVSLSSSEQQANGESGWPSISADGRYVAFESDATNLVAGDTNAQEDVFVRDVVAGTTVRVSVGPSGVQGNQGSHNPTIAGDGNRVAFGSFATNLVSGDTNAHVDIFVRDIGASTTTRVSVDSSEIASNGDSYRASISSGGNHVAFLSDATNLVTGDTNAQVDIFVRDLSAGTTSRASLASVATQANGGSHDPSISSNGRYVAFESDATNLVTGDTNGRRDIFVRDRNANQTTRVSVGPGGAQAAASCFAASISGDGQDVAFWSTASNLVAGDTNGDADIFLRDVGATATTRVSVSSSGTQSNSGSGGPAISGDGRCVAFYTDASNLVDGDTNATTDIFLHDRDGVNPVELFCFGDGSDGACPCGNESPVGQNAGCENSTGAAARLVISGSPQADPIGLLCTGLPFNTFCVLKRFVPASPIPFSSGDGLSCFGSSSFLYPSPPLVVTGGTISLSAGAAAPGQSRYFQVAYRDFAPGYCTPSNVNHSNAIGLHW